MRLFVLLHIFETNKRVNSMKLFCGVYSVLKPIFDEMFRKVIYSCVKIWVKWSDISQLKSSKFMIKNKQIKHLAHSYKHRLYMFL